VKEEEIVREEEKKGEDVVPEYQSEDGNFAAANKV
jgi:hypothetical protein